MKNAQTAAVATAVAAVAIGFALATSSGAATEPGGVAPTADKLAASVQSTSEATDASMSLSCGPDGALSVVSKHFGATYRSSPQKALESFLAEAGGTAKLTPADFRAEALNAGRTVYTTVGYASTAVVVDQVSPSVWDWRYGAACATHDLVRGWRMNWPAGS